MMKYVLILLMVLFTAPTYSQELSPLPVVENASMDELRAQSKEIVKQFEDNSGLNFKILIPQSFEVKPDSQLKNTSFNNQLEGEIFHAYGATVYDVRPYITIKSIGLERMISLKNWFLSYALQNNYTVRGFEEIGKNTVDVFYVRLDAFGRSEAVRSKVFFHENDVILVEYVSPTRFFEMEKNRQVFTIKSFEFMNEFRVVEPEKIAEYEFLDGFLMRYPESWVLTRKTSDIVNEHELELKTSDRRNFLFATTNVRVVSRRSFRDRVDSTVYPIGLVDKMNAIKQQIDELGYTPDEMLERHVYDDLVYETDIAVTEVFPIRRKKSENFMSEDKNPISNELWVTVIKTPETQNKNYIFSMIAPSRSTDFYNWAVAKEAYELMVKSAR